MPELSVILKSKSSNNEDVVITKQTLESISSLSQSTSDASTINYGVLANSGSMNIIDRNGKIAELIEDETLPTSNVNAEIYLGEKLIQKHITTDSNYDVDSKEFSVGLSNSIDNLSKLKYKGYKYPNQSKTAYEILYDVMNSYFGGSLTTEKFNEMLSNKCVYGNANEFKPISSYLKEIVIEYPYIKANQTYSAVINAFCNLAQLNFSEDDEGNFVFTSARPIEGNNNYINIPIYAQETVFNRDLVLKNKYDGVEISELNVIDEIDYDTVVYPVRVKLDGYKDSDFNKTTKKNQKIEERSQFISSATFYYEIVSYISSDYYYYSGSVTIPKKSEDNLSQIMKINDSLFRTNDFSYSLKYNKYKASASANGVWDRGDNYVSVSNISYGSDSLDSQIIESGVVTDTSSYTAQMPDSSSTTSSTSTSPDSPTITLSEDEHYYYVSYKICVQKKVTKLGGVDRWTASSTSSVAISLSGNIEKYIPLELEFSVYGNKRVISFTSGTVGSENVESAKTVATIPESDVLNNSAYIGEINASKVILDNILSDYSKGVRVGSVTISSINYKDGFGNTVIDWSNGDIISVGDIVSFPNQTYKDGTPILWRVTGREFTWDGEPLTRLEVMEVKFMPELITYEYVEEDKAYTVYSMSDDISGAVTIKSTYDDGVHGELNVTSIKDNGFYNKPNITSVTIPNSVKKIGQSAFGNTGLTSLTIPNSVTSIGKFAVNNCKNLTSITVGSGVTKLNGHEFQFNTNLREVNLSEGLKEIGQSCFYYCPNLMSIDIPSTVETIGTSSFAECISLQSITLPEGLKVIGAHAFSNCALFSITLPSTLTTIGSQAFAFTSLTALTIPKSVTTIDASFENASPFWDCPPSLVLTCEVSEKPSGWGEYFNYYDFRKQLTTNWLSPLSFTKSGNGYVVSGVLNENIKQIEIPDTYNGLPVTGINSSVFTNCKNLIKVVIGNNVTTIGDYAFLTCRNLLQVVLGSSVSSIGTEAFYNCNKLVEIYNLSSLSLYTGSESNGYIAYYAYEIHTNINDSSILEMWDDGFIMMYVYDSSLGKDRYKVMGYEGESKDIVLPWVHSSVSPFYQTYDIYKYAFFNSDIVSANIDVQGATSVGDCAFMDCNSLKTVIIADDVTKLGKSAFSGCSSLTDVTLSNGLTALESSTFYDCTSLRTLYIPSSIVTINAVTSTYSPFRGCSSSLVLNCGASKKPSGYGAYWNYYSTTGALAVNWGV